MASSEAIVPNAVGVDIGCGMGFLHLNVPPARVLREVSTPNGSLAQHMVGQIMRDVPQGFDHHRQRQKSDFLDNYPLKKLYRYGAKKLPELDEAYFQLGTLGGGNHFIELQEDEEGLLGIMVHTGSRNFGYKVANFFSTRWQKNSIKNEISGASAAPIGLPTLDTEEAKGGYIQWMNFALEFARQNRMLIMERVRKTVFGGGLAEFAGIKDVQVLMEVNAHHNYAAEENHFGRRVWVHRKGGAIRAARGGELAIIPGGAMGHYSYIVEGLGNPKSFNTASHGGAGRVMGRREAVRQFSVEEVLQDFKAKDIVLGKRRRRDTAEEYYKAYKDIDEVMENQKDLAKPVLKLQTVAVVKG